MQMGLGGCSLGSGASRGAGCKEAVAEAQEGSLRTRFWGTDRPFLLSVTPEPYLELRTVIDLVLTPKGVGFCKVLQPHP